MKNVFAATIVFLAASIGFAGTARQLEDLREQKVVADQLANLIPSMLQGNGGTLEECDLMNVAPEGKTSKMEVHCIFTSPLGQRAIATFDRIGLDRNYKVVSAAFKSLERE